MLIIWPLELSELCRPVLGFSLNAELFWWKDIQQMFTNFKTNVCCSFCLQLAMCFILTEIYHLLFAKIIGGMAAEVPANLDGYLCIYPAYLNGKKTIAEGRRIPRSKACDNPTFTEIRDVCAAAGLKPVVENKLYPRELYRGDVTYRGRVRVQLRNTKDELINEQIPDKKALLLHLGAMIPKLKTRMQKSGASGDSGSSQSHGKKKSQKKRRWWRMLFFCHRLIHCVLLRTVIQLKRSYFNRNCTKSLVDSRKRLFWIEAARLRPRRQRWLGWQLRFQENSIAEKRKLS